MDVTIAGPPSLIPRDVEALGVKVEYTLDRLGEADVVYLLRMQMERMQEGANFIPSLREYSTLYGMTLERLRPGQKVMHPGPINRGVEISPAVADHPDTLILEQVESGLAVRMAILYRTIAATTSAPPTRGVRHDGAHVVQVRRGRRSADPRRPRRRPAGRSRPGRRRAGPQGPHQRDRRQPRGARQGACRDRRGRLLLPGFVDLHTHLRTPGREDEEDLRTASAAAAAGGYVAVFGMANTEPVVDSAPVLEGLARQAAVEATVPTASSPR